MMKTKPKISLGSAVQSIVSLTSSLMTNKLTIVAKVFLSTLIFLLQIISMHLPYFKIDILISY